MDMVEKGIETGQAEEPVHAVKRCVDIGSGYRLSRRVDRRDQLTVPDLHRVWLMHQPALADDHEEVMVRRDIKRLPLLVEELGVMAGGLPGLGGEV